MASFTGLSWIPQERRSTWNVVGWWSVPVKNSDHAMPGRRDWQSLLQPKASGQKRVFRGTLLRRPEKEAATRSKKTGDHCAVELQPARRRGVEALDRELLGSVADHLGVFDRNRSRDVTEESSPFFPRLEPDPAEVLPADRERDARKPSSRPDVDHGSDRRQEVCPECRLEGVRNQLFRGKPARQVDGPPPAVELGEETGQAKPSRIVQIQPEGGELLLEKVSKCLRPKRFGTGRHARRLSRRRPE